jgi:preprotein translocase YajC subunit
MGQFTIKCPLCQIDLERKDAMLAAWTALLADATPPAAGPGASMDMLIFLVAPLALFVLFIVMPMKREARVRKELLGTLKNGDWVILNGSMLAKIAQIVPSDKRAGEDVIVVKLDENANVKATYLRSAVTRIIKSDESTTKEGA